jgi:hypothetical protein
VLTKDATGLRLWVLQMQVGKPMPKAQRFAGAGLVRHGHRVPGMTNSDAIGTQVGQKRVRTGRIGSAPMALGVEPQMPCISTRMGLRHQEPACHFLCSGLRVTAICIASNKVAVLCYH